MTTAKKLCFAVGCRKLEGTLPIGPVEFIGLFENLEDASEFAEYKNSKDTEKEYETYGGFGFLVPDEQQNNKVVC